MLVHEELSVQSQQADASPEMATALQEAEELSKQLGSMDNAKADHIIAATDKAKAEMGTDDFLRWASKLLGFQQKGSKEVVAKNVKSFVDRLATSAAQTGSF